MRALLTILSGSLLGLAGCGGWGSGPDGGRGYGMMGGYGGYGLFGMMGGGPFGMILGGLFWLVIIAVVIWATWHFTAGRRIASKSDETPLGTLKRRLASGEITHKQFTKAKKTLEEKK